MQRPRAAAAVAGVFIVLRVCLAQSIGQPSLELLAAGKKPRHHVDHVETIAFFRRADGDDTSAAEATRERLGDNEQSSAREASSGSWFSWWWPGGGKAKPGPPSPLVPPANTPKEGAATGSGSSGGWFASWLPGEEAPAARQPEEPAETVSQPAADVTSATKPASGELSAVKKVYHKKAHRKSAERAETEAMRPGKQETSSWWTWWLPATPAATASETPATTTTTAPELESSAGQSLTDWLAAEPATAAPPASGATREKVPPLVSRRTEFDNFGEKYVAPAPPPVKAPAAAPIPSAVPKPAPEAAPETAEEAAAEADLEAIPEAVEDAPKEAAPESAKGDSSQPAAVKAALREDLEKELESTEAAEDKHGEVKVVRRNKYGESEGHWTVRAPAKDSAVPVAASAEKPASKSWWASWRDWWNGSSTTAPSERVTTAPARAQEKSLRSSPSASGWESDAETERSEAEEREEETPKPRHLERPRRRPRSDLDGHGDPIFAAPVPDGHTSQVSPHHPNSDREWDPEGHTYEIQDGPITELPKYKSGAPRASSAASLLAAVACALAPAP